MMATIEPNSNILLLTKLQFCHVIDNNTGVVRLVEGPFRGPLESNEAVYGLLRNKHIVKEGQYAVILNPYNSEKKDVQHGDREIRVGPLIFSLYPGELLEDGMIHQEYVLIRDTGLLIKAVRDFTDGDIPRTAGDRWIIEGPSRYIPHKYALVEKNVQAISLGLDDGIYVKNIRTGNIRLEKGPKSLMLLPEEELFEKEYSQREYQALRLVEGELDPTRAIPLRLLKKQVMMVTSGDSQRVEFGPKVILLEPYEKPYIMSLSGNTPKVPSALKVWYILLGPEFSTDELSVRTKDNAVLLIRLRYKWRFRVEKEHPERIFAVEDFIGLATETMAGLIREEAAKHNFEDLHSQAADFVKKVVFGEKESYVFTENGFEIFGIDIKRIAPEDAEIAAQLNSAIKSNMQVYVQKIQQAAQLEAEKELVEGKTTIEKSKTHLIELEQDNIRTQILGKAKIEAEAEIEKARGEAEAIKLRKQAETSAEMNRVSQMIEELRKEGAETYIHLQQVQSFNNVDKTYIVPTDSRLFIPMEQRSSHSAKNLFFDDDNCQK